MFAKKLVDRNWVRRFFAKSKGNKFDASKLENTLQSWESKQLNKILSKHTKTEKTTEERLEEMDSAHFKGMDDFFHSSKGNAMYEDMMQDETDKESVLRSWKKADMNVDNLFDKFDNKKVDDYINKFQKFQEKSNAYFEKSETGADLANRSRQIINSKANQMPWSPDEEFNSHHVDYDRYSSYKENYVRLKENIDENMHRMNNTTDSEQYGRSIQKFLQNMDSEIVGDHHQKYMDVSFKQHPYAEPGAMGEQKNDDKWDSIYGDEKPETMDEDDRVEARIKGTVDQKRQEKVEDFEPSENLYDTEFNYEEWLEDNNSSFIGLDNEDKEGDEFLPDKRFSLDGKFELYDCYLRGENIRTLSLKFGLHPLRIRAIVWDMQYFMEHILPNADMDGIRMAMYVEKNIVEENIPCVSYGVDLTILGKQQAGVETRTTKFRQTHANPPSEETKARVTELLEKAKKPKYDAIAQYYTGGAWNGYYVYDYRAYRGHGSERVQKNFRKVLQNSGTKWDMGLPRKAELKLRDGNCPRVVAKGYGVH